MKKFVLLTVSHAAAAAIGFALGIYVLPILIAPKAPSSAEVKSLAGSARYTGQFRKDLREATCCTGAKGRCPSARRRWR